MSRFSATHSANTGSAYLPTTVSVTTSIPDWIVARLSALRPVCRIRAPAQLPTTATVKRTTGGSTAVEFVTVESMGNAIAVNTH